MVFILLFHLSVVMGRPEIWPPTGQLRPNDYAPPPLCKFVPTVIEEDTLEKRCRIEENRVCQDVVVDGFDEITKEVCVNGTPVMICENKTVYQLVEKCEKVSCNKDDYNIEMKKECAYETKVDKKCWRRYGVKYRDECFSEHKKKCKISSDTKCKGKYKMSCKKVPQPLKKYCLGVPRLKRSNNCYEIPVRRPKCLTETVCKTVQSPTSKEVCEKSEGERICEKVVSKVPSKKKKSFCKTEPSEICTSEKVSKPKIVNERICEEEKVQKSTNNKLIVAVLDKKSIFN